jgi:hypothetical protein
MKCEVNFKAEQLTIGDLIIAITDAALEVTEDEDMAYQIAGLVFMRLVAASSPQTAEYLLAACAGTTIH